MLYLTSNHRGRRRFAAIDYGQPIIPIMVDDAYFFPPSVRCTHTRVCVRVERSIRVPFVYVYADQNGVVFFNATSTKKKKKEVIIVLH